MQMMSAHNGRYERIFMILVVRTLFGLFDRISVLVCSLYSIMYVPQM